MSSVDPLLHNPQVDTAILTVGSDVTINKQLNFWAHGVIIDNLSNQWIFVRESYSFVPPYTAGKQIPIKGAQTVNILLRAPGGFTSPGIINGQQVVITFTEAPVPATPGIPVTPTVASILTNGDVSLDSPGAGFTAIGGPYAVAGAYVFGVSFSLRQGGNAAASISAAIRGDTSGTIFSLANLQFAVAGQIANTVMFTPPILVSRVLAASDVNFHTGLSCEAAVAGMSVRGFAYIGTV